MTALSDEFQAVAAEIVDLFGKDYVIRRPTPTYPDPDKPTMVVMENVDYPCKAALVSFTEEQIKMLQVLREDMQAIIAWNENLPPKLVPGDLFIDGESIFKIVPPEEVYSVNGVIVAWRAIVRR